jgi:hypothetical protein
MSKKSKKSNKKKNKGKNKNKNNQAHNDDDSDDTWTYVLVGATTAVAGWAAGQLMDQVL